eukprot:TRINITY_DN10267_c0_g1_i1.p1 TRINITY_DN10267_c0_g1~~TRINITY_DN10267_c0_g1_i1.p1  ORF type:complete len:297 (+),score=39.41 TRINITY_DN10267_c0_g1_i1:157-1047(+)
MSKPKPVKEKEEALPKREIKPVFKVIHTGPAENTKWSSEEHAALINAIRAYKQNWDKICPCVPTKKRSEVVSEAESILRKFTVFNKDPVELIQNTSTQSLIQFIAGKSEEVKRGDRQNKVPKVVPKHAKTVATNLNTPLNPSKKMGKNVLKRSTNSSAAPSQKTMKRTKLKDSLQVEGNVPVVEEEKKEGKRVISLIPPLAKESLDVITKLSNIQNEARFISNKLRTEEASCNSLSDTDKDFKNYRDSLVKCCSALQNIVSDIHFIHVNTMPKHSQSIPLYPPNLEYLQVLRKSGI